MSKVKKRTLIIIAAILAVLTILIIGFSAFIGQQVFSASTQLVTNEETQGISEAFAEKYDMNYEGFLDTYKVEELKIQSSFDNHMIPADYIYTNSPDQTKDSPTVILVHGMGDNRYSTYPWAQFFLETGYNVIAYDQRSSNANTAEYTTFGYWEKYDLIDWVSYFEEQAPGQTLVVWGASYGGATAGLAAGHEDIQDKIDFLILDSPVSSMKWMVEEEMRNLNTGLPIAYMTWWGDMVNKFQLDFTYQEADVATAMKDVKIPVLIINSKQDLLTPYFMGRDIYNSISGDKKEMWTVNDSEHLEVWVDYNQEYRDKLEIFLTH